MPEYRVLNEKMGVSTHGNPLTLAKGLLKVGNNWECVRDNVYRKPRGRAAYGTGLPAQSINQFFEYKDRLFVHLSNGELWYDSTGTGTFLQVGAVAYSAPEAGKRIEAVEMNGNLYFTTSEGIKKLDSLPSAGGVVESAGMPPALDFDLRFVVGSEPILATTAVSYRHLWTKVDSNDNRIVGFPSYRQDIDNAGATTFSVSLRVTLPEDITVDHYLEIYRSSRVATTVIPPEDFQLVYQAHPTASEVSLGYMTVVDNMPDGFRGSDLYTNTTQEGIEQANSRPPKAVSITKYKNYMFYGNTESIHRVYTNLISVTGLTTASTIKISDGVTTLTLGAAADIVDRTVANPGVADLGGFCEITTTAPHTYTSGEYVRFLDVTAAGATFPPAVNDKIFQVTVTAPTKFTIPLVWAAGYDATGGTLDFYEDIGATPRFVIHTAGTTTEDIEDTSRSICKAINQASGNTKWYAYYTSGLEDPVGKILITTDTVGLPAFYLQANSTATGNSFTTAIPVAPDVTYISTNDDFQNAVMWSKADQPEAVPLINIQQQGAKDDPVVSVKGLRDSLFVIKNNDGTIKMTGEGSPFSFDVFDESVGCIQPYSITKGVNAIFMFTDSGYVKLTDVGAEAIGRSNEFKDISTRFSTNFETDGYGWFYEEEGTYFISTHSLTTSTSNDVVWTYNSFQNAWMKRKYGVYTNDSHVGVGIVINGYMYTSAVTGNKIFKERKSYTANDMYSPDIVNTITAIDPLTNIITVGTASTINVGAYITQGLIRKNISSIVDTTHFTLSSVNNLALNISKTVANCVDNGGGLIRVSTTVAHTLVTGNSVIVSGVTGCTEANGTWFITLVNATTFDLINSVFANAYTGGPGTVTNLITIFMGIESDINYHLVHCGTPEYDKSFQKIEVFFDNDETLVSKFYLLTATDLETTQQVTDMVPATGVWGSSPWGAYWGTKKVSDRILTFLPEEHSRGSALDVEFVHNKAGQKAAICGFSLVYDNIDTRIKT